MTYFFCIYLLVMPKYWGKQILTHGRFPEVGQKQKTYASMHGARKPPGLKEVDIVFSRKYIILTSGSNSRKYKVQLCIPVNHTQYTIYSIILYIQYKQRHFLTFLQQYYNRLGTVLFVLTILLLAPPLIQYKIIKQIQLI